MNDYDAARIAQLTASAINSAVAEAGREVEELITNQEAAGAELVRKAEELIRALREATDGVNQRTRDEMTTILQEMREHSDRLSARVTDFIRHCDESIKTLRSHHTLINGGKVVSEPKLPPVNPVPSFIARGPRRHDDDTA